MNKFNMTNEGYIKAKEYLKSINMLDKFENNKTSVDGYSLVSFANEAYRQINNKEDK